MEFSVKKFDSHKQNQSPWPSDPDGLAGHCLVVRAVPVLMRWVKLPCDRAIRQVQLVHFRVEINLRDFERLVAEPVLDFHQIEAGAEPVRRRGLAKSVEVMFLAYRPRFARRFYFMPVVVSAFSDRRLALPAIPPGAFGNRLELAEEVAFGFAILVGKNPTVRHSVLLVAGQQRTQFGRQGNLSLLVILWKEGDIGLALAARCETQSLRSRSFQVAYWTSCSRHPVRTKKRYRRYSSGVIAAKSLDSSSGLYAFVRVR